jgi:cysteine-rich repeat protein
MLGAQLERRVDATVRNIHERRRRQSAFLCDQGGSDARMLGAGEFFACAIKTDDSVACWGQNAASLVAPAASFAQIGAGSSHACGVRTDDIVSCWGSSASWSGMLPTGSFLEVDAGYAHSCALRSDGTITCFSVNNSNGRASPSSTAFAPEVCGDGLVVGQETCDDDNSVSSDGCSASCRIETGFTCSGEPSVCGP